MKLKGYTSERSKAGVRIDKLTEICECSHQMVRRYVLGEALPVIDVTLKIAKWFSISPGWLLFGDDSKVPDNIDKTNLIQIDGDLLEYILLKSSALFFVTNNIKELVSFIMDIINDTTNIEADRKSILKIVDLSVKSVTRFNGKENEKKSLLG